MSRMQGHDESSIGTDRSNRGGERATIMCMLIRTAKLERQACGLARRCTRPHQGHNIQTLDQLHPWDRKTASTKLGA
jgi:hypothetical protein